MASCTGNMITIIGAGTATIMANQASDVNYDPGSTFFTLTVNKAQPILTSMSPILKTYGDSNFTISLPTSSSSGITN